MPLYNRFESLERPDHFIEYPLLSAGEAGYFEDKSIGGFIVARCTLIDMGGYLFTAHEVQSSVTSALIIECSDEDLAEQILPGMSAKVEIINEYNEYGNLITQHVMPNGQINSLN